MNNYIKNIGLLFIAISLFSCSSDDDENNESTFQEENFLIGYLEATGFNQEEGYFIANGNYELGLDFTPLVTGNITALKVKLPQVNPNLRITIWDKATNNPIFTAIVNVAAPDTEVVFELTDLELTKDRAYLISMNTNMWYQYKKADETEATYPVIVGNIQINAYRASNQSTQQVYPTGFVTNFYYGDLSFDFLQTD